MTGLVLVSVFQKFSTFSGCRCDLGLTVKERMIVVVVEYFQVNRLFVGSRRFKNDLSTSLH